MSGLLDRDFSYDTLSLPVYNMMADTYDSYENYLELDRWMMGSMFIEVFRRMNSEPEDATISTHIGPKNGRGIRDRACERKWLKWKMRKKKRL